MTPDPGPFGAAWSDRRYLLNIAYRLVGSYSDAEDLVQEAFTRLLRTDQAIDDPRAWLVVVLTRLCLDHLRSARVRRETTVGPWFPEPLVRAGELAGDPADAVVLDESVRMALLVVLERLRPAERAVFVLHDVFQFSFAEIAGIVGRTPAACRQLGSRARRAIRDEADDTSAVAAEDLRDVAERFIAACSGGDVEELLDVLAPNVVGWADVGGLPTQLPQRAEGAREVADGTLRLFGPATQTVLQLAQVNGETGIMVALRDRAFAVLALRVRDGRIAAIYAIADPAKLRHVRIQARPS